MTDLRAGMRLPFFEPGDESTTLSASRMNPLLQVANAVLNIQIQRRPAVADADGTITPSGSVKFTNDNMVIELLDGTGSTLFLNTAQSYTASCPSGSTGSTVSVTVNAGTLGSDVSQADADALALELATDRATLALVCTPTATQGVNSYVTQVSESPTGVVVACGRFTRAQNIYRPSLCAFYPESLMLHPSCWPMAFVSTSGFGAQDGIVGAFIFNSSGDIIAVGAFNHVATDNCVTAVAMDVYNGGTSLFSRNGESDVTEMGQTPGFANDSIGIVLGEFVGAAKTSNGRPLFAFSSGTGTYRGTPIGNLIRMSVPGLGGSIDFNYPITNAISGRPGFAKLRWDNGTLCTLADFLTVGSANHYKYSGVSIGSKYYLQISSADAMISYTDVGTGFSALPSDLYPIPSGDLVFVGNGLTYNGHAQTHILQTDRSGGFVTTINANVAFSPSGPGTIESQMVGGVRKYLVGGFFTTVGGANHAGIVRLNADGSIESTWTGPTTISGSGGVYSICVLSTGNIVIGGSFTTIDGLTRNNIALLDANGTLLGSG